MKKNKPIIKYNLKSVVLAFCMSAVIFALVGLAVVGSEGIQVGYFWALLLSAILAGMFILLDFSFGKISSVLIYLLTPVAVLWALENYTHVITDMVPKIILLNLLFFYLFFLVCIFLTGSVKTGIMLGVLVPMIFGFANYFVLQFRGTPIVPWDFQSFGTALSVAGKYEFTFTWKIVLSLVVFLWLILIASKSTVKIRRWYIRFPGFILSAVLFIGYITGIQQPDIQKFFDMDKSLFTLKKVYGNNGVTGGFLAILRFLNVKEPDGYSVEAVERIVENNDISEEISESETEYPNIIVIMNEAFSDLSVWGEYTTNQEVLPFFQAMQKEGIGGELYVSVIGGYTANSEYEFLTGDTMAFLPTGSVPYQQYVKSDMPSLTSYLENLGYQTLAIHPFRRHGWDRDKVYEYFGFDNYLDKDAFQDPYLIRGLISDKSAYEKIVEQFEQKQDESPIFIFEVTMQNHGGYTKENSDFTPYIELENYSKKTTRMKAAEEYLTLVNESDQAIQKLIQYFEQQEEPVIVLMFGDHQPSDYIAKAIRKVSGTVQGDSLEEQQKGYRVPFAIWSNQELEHEYYEGISVNYLSGILLDAAGVPLSDYQKWLKQLMQTLPIISGRVYADKDDRFYSYEEETVYEDILREYNILQYNHLLDRENRVDGFFD